MIIFVVLDVLGFEVPARYSAAERPALCVQKTNSPPLARDRAQGEEDYARDEEGPQEVERNLIVREEVAERVEGRCVFSPDVVEEEVEMGGHGFIILGLVPFHAQCSSVRFEFREKSHNHLRVKLTFDQFQRQKIILQHELTRRGVNVQENPFNIADNVFACLPQIWTLDVQECRKQEICRIRTLLKLPYDREGKFVKLVLLLPVFTLSE